jgi:hypothetical protein
MFPALDVRAAVEEDGEFRNPVRERVGRFFEEAPDFDLGTTPVDSYIEENASRVLPEADQRDVIADQVKSLQRVYQVAPRYDQTSALLGEGLDSALSISSLSEDTFVQQFEPALGGEEEARQVHANARQMTATATNLIATIHQATNDVTPQAMGGSAVSAELLRQLPDWATLFGRVDLCDCADCRSIYGPAAYFVDLLQFLNPKVLPQGVTQRPIEVLRRRRLDLEHLQLTCENTNTTLPYVDLVNEVLEDVIAPDYSAVGDFSATQNPSGAWSYGWQSPTVSFWRYTKHDNPWGAGLNRWTLEVPEPMVTYNNTGGTASYLTITQPPDVLNLLPGPSGQKSTVRWTAPSSGEVKIEGRFEGLDTRGTTTDVAVVQKSAATPSGTTLFSGNINAYGARAPFSIIQSVTAGDTIDFSVGYGGNATNFNDSTGLSITIDYLPKRQTRGTSEQLSVNPEYVNAKAYAKLAQADFPFSLPFDLNLETVRAYLGHLGTSRYELMDIFEKAFQEDETVSALERASEYFLLSPRERDVIAGSQTATRVHEFYGYEVATPPTETIWMEDQLPKDSKLWEPASYWWGTHDPWEWVTADPTPFSGSRALRLAVASGVHGHVFANATEILAPEPGDRLYVNLYLDPQSPPAEVMLEWYDGTSWAHCAYWGKDTIDWGEETKNRQYMGPLPSAGKWVRLEVAAGQVGLENRTISGMTFALHGGRATWDRVGKRSATWYEYLAHLARVPEFLHRTGLNFDELLDLLATRFVNSNPAAPTVVLRPHHDPCDLGTTVLDNLTANDNAALKNIHRFVRLWRKVGGPMSDLDKAISALGGGLDGEFLVNFADAKRLQNDLRVPLVQLLSLWSNLDTHGTRATDASGDTRGADALYTTLFQNKAVFSPLDPDFALTPDRSQVVGTSQSLDSKKPVLLAALRLSAADLAAIRADAGLADSDAKLSLANLSTLYRYALLARALDLSVQDLLSLKKLAGFDPFASPENTLGFAETLRKVRESGFSVALLDYLLRDIAEPTADFAPAAASIDEFVRTLKANLARIAEENAPQPDPTGERLRRLLSTVLDPGALDRAMQLVEGMAIYTAPLNALPNIRFPDELASKVSYHADTRELRFVGAMTEAERTKLLGLSTVAEYRSAVERLFQQPRSFIDDYLTFLPGTEARTLLLASLGADPEAARQQRRSFVSSYLLAYLRDVQSRALIVQTLSGLLSLEAPAITRLLEEILKAHDDPSKPAMHDFLALAGPGVGDGLSATYFDNVDLTGTSVTRIDPTVNFSWGTGVPTPGIGPETFSVRWTGKVLAAHSQMYTFYTETDDGVRLWVDGQKLIDNWQAQGETKNQATILLQAGRLYDITMEFCENGNIAAAKLLWSSASTPKAIIPQSHLFSGNASAPYRVPLKTYYRLHKIALIVTTFRMTPEELRYLAEHSAKFFKLDLNRLPLDGEPTPVEVASLFDGWVRLSELFAVKSSLPAAGKSLLDVFETAKAAGATLDGVLDTLAAATGWNRSDLGVVCGPAGMNLVDPRLFLTAHYLPRIQSALALGRRLGVPTAQIVSWATSTADAAQAKSIKETVKAKYDDEAWLRIAAPLSDSLRERQRAALITYVLRQPVIRDAGITDSNQLFEYFLIDVEMTACMKTSRMKQAISSVQLFVQRCLLNLEPAVPPEAIDADQWKWMKNYRLWEANRKVFLYPENWIEPELRDDKSPFFQGLENDLLQNEVTAETAQMAYARYLENVNEVAYLEICGFWLEWFGTGKPETIHLFARTFAVPHVYYYRRGVGWPWTTWTAWEKIDLDIQGDHLSPGMREARQRLFLFWPIFEKIAVPQEQPQGESPPRERWDIKLAWSEYKQGYWSARRVSSQSLRSPDFVPASIDDRGDKLRYEVKARGEDVLEIQAIESLGPSPSSSFMEQMRSFGAFVFSDARNTVEVDTSSPIIWTLPLYAHPPNTHVAGTARMANAGITSLKLASYYPTRVEHVVLNNTPTPYRVVSNQYENPRVTRQMPGQPGPLPGIWLSRPFFYQDQQHVYFVEGLGNRWSTQTGIRFAIHYHPHVAAFLAAFNEGGIRGLLTLENQKLPDPRWLDSRVQGMAFTLYGGRVTWDHAGKAGEQGEETVWVEDDLPAGATKFGDKEDWTWVSTNPSPFSGTRAHQSNLVANDWHQHLFLGATEALGIEPGDKLFAYVYLDPTNPPEQIMLQWHSGNWDHRAYWGANKIPWGQDGTASRRYMGPLPKAGEWVRLEVPAEIVNLARTLFSEQYQPDAQVRQFPEEEVAFKSRDAYSLYNWELFFHGPLFIADRLSKEQRFEEAQRWFHYVFDPTNDSPGEPSPQRYWRFRPFNDKTEVERIQELLYALTDPNGDAQVRQEMQQQVAAWRDNPFQPHLIARQRLGAYQKAVVMKYIDNLIAWGDQLFARDTIESINEATLLYVLAHDLLGPRPERIPELSVPVVKTYQELQSSLDEFSNALVEVQNRFPFALGASPNGSSSQAVANGLGLGQTLYFGIPRNDKLLSYWDKVEDRLFKVRHCLNIEGVRRSLALFEPPIEPGLLVRAAAAGVDLGSVLSDLNAPLGLYRFSYLLPKALELCGEVKSLGGALLAALEKKDAETLSNLRARQESAMLRLVRQIKERQIEEAKTALEGLQKTRAVTEFRYKHYKNIVQINAREREHLRRIDAAQRYQVASQVAELLVAVQALFPEATIGISGISSPVVTFQFGGANLAGALQGFSKAMSFLASLETYQANRAATLGGWDRRSEDWKLQEELASRELEQIDKQILGAETRVAIAERELENHKRQVANSEEVEVFLRDKYTNQELYTWMSSQLSRLYFQTYQLAYDAAKRAEKAFRFERGLTSSNFIQFGYWDSLKQGLLAGERLHLDLKRLEMAYLDQNAREYELTKHVSLVLHDPLALIALKETGRCRIELPEALFDMDHPGHYMRRIKSVSITIPGVVGPYTGINATLTLLSSRIRTDSSPASPYKEKANDGRFLRDFSATQSIATSHANNDAGLFELNFRDERYLPFEGAGAVSEWRLDLPKETNAFDLNTISDVVLRINYTAREGGDRLRGEALKAATLPPPPQQDTTGTAVTLPAQENMRRLFSAKHEFPGEWHRFLHPQDADDEQVLQLDLTTERFPYQFRGKTVRIKQLELFMKLKDEEDEAKYRDGGDLTSYLAPPAPATEASGTLASDATFFEGVPHAMIDVSNRAKGIGTWLLKARSPDIAQLHPDLRTSATVNGITRHHLRSDTIEDLFVVCHYSITG